MSWIALKMLTGDRSKYYAIIFGVTFACLLIAQQSAIFCGIMLRTTSQIRDTHGHAKQLAYLPTHQGGAEADRIHWKNLPREAEERLVAWGMDTVSSLFGPLC